MRKEPEWCNSSIFIDMSIRAEKISSLVEFIAHSNAIEGVYSIEAVQDSLDAWKNIESIEVMTIKIMRQIHKDVMRRLNKRIAGKIRRVNVSVGGRTCPPPYKLIKMLKVWLNEHEFVRGEEDIKRAHVEWEKIHPFEDGNGRTGRIIMNWQRVRAGLPIQVIHEGAEQYEYYSWFK